MLHSITQKPKIDLYFLADWTGSMSSAMANVKANLVHVYQAFVAKNTQWDVQLGVGAYADVADGARVFQSLSSITDNGTTIQNAANKLISSGGGDLPEAQAYALTYIAENGSEIGWRVGSTRVIIWFGDQIGHDPVVYNHKNYTFNNAIEQMVDRNIRVFAFSVAPTNNLDGSGQATLVTNKTNGVTNGRYLMSNVVQANVVETIFKNLKGEVAS